MEVPNKNPELLYAFAEELLSYSEYYHKRALDTFFFPDVIYSSTLITTQGTLNLRRIFHTWTALNKDEPIIDNIIFDGQTCIIHLQQNLRPRIFPLLHLQVPAITTLHFRPDPNGPEGFSKVWKQEDTWTLEGLLQAVPLLSWWYENVVRVIMGKLVTGTGDFLYAASQTANSINHRSRELHITTNEITKKVGDRVHQYREDLQMNLESQVSKIKTTLEEKAGRNDSTRGHSIYNNKAIEDKSRTTKDSLSFMGRQNEYPTDIEQNNMEMNGAVKEDESYADAVKYGEDGLSDTNDLDMNEMVKSGESFADAVKYGGENPDTNMEEEDLATDTMVNDKSFADVVKDGDLDHSQELYGDENDIQYINGEKVGESLAE